ncbi:hypothetical protein ERUR111494_02920 [Erysipelothrix urinaevulpis]
MRIHEEPFIEDHSEYGVCLPLNQENQTFDYMIGIKAPLDPIQGYVIASIPAATFAVFMVPNKNGDTFSTNIQNTWNYIFNEWFSTSDYQLDDSSYDYEFYPMVDKNDTTQRCEIYLPVKKK